jgi:outer membrane protein
MSLENYVNSLVKKFMLKVIFLAFVFTSFSVVAQDDVAVSEGMKVGVLDMATALFNSERAQGVSDEVTLETEEDQQKIRDLATEAQRLQEELQQNAAVLSEDEQRRMAENIQELAVQYDFLVQKVEAYVEQKRQEFQQTYAPNLVQAITELVEEEEFDIVFRAEAALHYRGAYDITARVTEKLNQQ